MVSILDRNLGPRPCQAVEGKGSCSVEPHEPPQVSSQLCLGQAGQLAAVLAGVDAMLASLVSTHLSCPSQASVPSVESASTVVRVAAACRASHDLNVKGSGVVFID